MMQLQLQQQRALVAQSYPRRWSRHRIQSNLNTDPVEAVVKSEESSPTSTSPTAPTGPALQQSQQQAEQQPTIPPPLFQKSFSDYNDWTVFLGTLANNGAINGTLLDGIHSRVGLQVYDVAPLTVGPLTTAATVPPLLAVFYMAVGSLFLLSDNLAVMEGDVATAAARERSADVAWVALSTGALAAGLQLSAWMYSTDVPFWQISLVLAAVSVLMWRCFDGTKQGLALGVLCAVGAPAAELVLNGALGLWHYPRGDILGGAFVSWVPFCYFFYTPVLGTWARFLGQFRD